MKESLATSPSSDVRCEPDRLIMWLSEILTSAVDDVNVCVVIEEERDAGVSVQITVRGVRRPLAGLDVRGLA